jgi:hypothetical protein
MRDREPRVRFGSSSRDRGIALLTLLAVVALGAALALIAIVNPRPSDLKREEVTNRALARAKEALIAYAATYSDAHPGEVPGYLPCPDQAGGNPEGVADAALCGAKDVTVIGRLPWRTLGVEPLRDGAGECFWYAVSGRFKNSPKTDVMNWDTLGQIEVYGPDAATLVAGAQPELRAAAVVFSPGVALGQDRQDDNPGTAQAPVCSEDYVPAHFLEAVGAVNNALANGTPGAVTKFVAGAKGNDFNDQLSFVTPTEIFAAVEKRRDFPAIAAKSVAECLVNYLKNNANWSGGDFRFPWAARVALTGYLDSIAYDDSADQMAGRFPYLVDDTNGANPTSALTATCPDQKNWWANWKEYFFYALAEDFKPSPSPGPPSRPLPLTCGSGCLQVDGVGGQVAVLMFAGKALKELNQARSPEAAKGALGNYLEGRNLTNYPNATGNGNYEKISPTNAPLNDVLWCVRIGAGGRPEAAACP